MRIKEITVGGSYTLQPEPYHSVKGEFSILAEVAPGEDADKVAAKLQTRMTAGLKLALTNVLTLHYEVKDAKSETDDDDGWS